jgi:hypothetical protein
MKNGSKLKASTGQRKRQKKTIGDTRKKCKWYLKTLRGQHRLKKSAESWKRNVRRTYKSRG